VAGESSSPATPFFGIPPFCEKLHRVDQSEIYGIFSVPPEKQYAMNLEAGSIVSTTAVSSNLMIFVGWLGKHFEGGDA
jgi:hypothetical protein